jgi:hypothetical protein
MQCLLQSLLAEHVLAPKEAGVHLLIILSFDLGKADDINLLLISSGGAPVALQYLA